MKYMVALKKKSERGLLLRDEESENTNHNVKK
jgi:hypothetical protein